MTAAKGPPHLKHPRLPAILLALAVFSVVAPWIFSSLANNAATRLGTEAEFDRVVLVGIEDWGWAELAEMPATETLASNNLASNLIVRGTNLHTCASDGWLTLGAGQRAASINTALAPCEVPGNAPAQWASWQDYANEQSLVAELGTLGQTITDDGGCVQATGSLAALGAADRSGAVANERSGNLDNWPGVGECEVDLIDTQGMSREQIDASIADLEATLPDNTLLLVAGLSDRADLAQPAVHPVLAAAIQRPAATPSNGLLTSTSTRQPGLIQTTDLSATILSSLGHQPPDAIAGLPVDYLPAQEPPTEGPTAGNDVAALASTAMAATLVTNTQSMYVGALAAILVIGLVIALVSRRPRAVALLGSAVMAAPAAAYAASLLPWWAPALGTWPITGIGLATALAIAATLLILAALLALAWGGPWRSDPRAPIAIIAAATFAVLAVDVVLGGPLGLISQLGVAPVVAGRFYGVGNVAFGILSAAALILATCLASWWRANPGLAAGAVVVVGVLATAIDGVPAWGADFGGVPAMVVSTALLALLAAGKQLTWGRAALIALVAAVVAGSLMIFDWLRPPGSRTHLGEFVQAVIDGQAWGIVTRKLDQSVGILIAYPASWIAVAVLLLVAWLVTKPDLRLWQIPMMRAGASALLLCWLLGWVLNDSGIAVAALGLTVAIGAGLVLAAHAHAQPKVATPKRRTV